MKPYFVSTEEYPDDLEPLLFETSTGLNSQFDPSNPGSKVVTESEGLPVYFMQYLLLGKIMVLCFYDTGAQMSLIETALARSLKLPMIRREGFLLVGAGNHVTYTDDGTYELVLGSRQDKEIFRISVSGMPILTGPMTYDNVSGQGSICRQ